MNIIVTRQSPRLKDVPEAKITLKPHQLAMLYKCCEVEKRVVEKHYEVVSTFNAEDIQKQTAEVSPEKRKELEKEGYAVISAPVGCGKTYLILSLCLMDRYLKKESKIVDKIFELFTKMYKAPQPSAQQQSKDKDKNKDKDSNLNNNKVETDQTGKEKREYTGSTLIVVPSHIFGQWQDAIKDFVGDALSVFYFNSYADTNQLYTTDLSMLQKSDIFLVSSMYYQTVVTSLTSAKVTFKRVVMDELDSMAKMINYRAPAAITWIVSATINALVQDSGLQIDNPVNPIVIPKEVLMKNTVDCDREFIKESFALPLITGEKQMFSHNFVDSEFVEILEPLSKQAIFGEDPKEACVIEIKHYDEVSTVIDVAKQMVKGWTDQKKMLEDKEEIDAPTREKINVLSKKIATTQRCLTNIGIKEGQCEFPKFDAVINMCKEYNDKAKKLMVFSMQPRIILKIANELEKLSIKYVDLEGGNKEQMAKSIKKYKTDNETNIMLMHSTMFSCGTNLENTDHIVFMHHVDSVLKNQVIGRAQRPGRASELGVTELLYNSEQQ